jgi:hypothetical protein
MRNEYCCLSRAKISLVSVTTLSCDTAYNIFMSLGFNSNKLTVWWGEKVDRPTEEAIITKSVSFHKSGLEN